MRYLGNLPILAHYFLQIIQNIQNNNSIFFPKRKIIYIYFVIFLRIGHEQHQDQCIFQDIFTKN